tara:strand:- start:14423 stop:14551 length:129 start_codon:yes stop_codon:yes gene_type:complete
MEYPDDLSGLIALFTEFRILIIYRNLSINSPNVSRNDSMSNL